MRTVAYRLSLLLIFMIPWEGLIRFPGLGTAAKLTGLALAVFWATTVVTTGRLRRPDPFLLATGVFVLWVALSVFWSADPRQSLGHAFTWVQSFGFALLLWDLYRTRAALMAGLQAYVLGAYVAVGGALVNYLASNPFYTHYDRFSPGATNPDGFGFIVALGIPLAWFLGGSQGTTKMLRFLRVVNYAYIPAAFLGLALSGTRTAAIGAVVGMAFGLASLTRLRLPVLVAVLALLAYAVYALLPVVQPLRSFQRLGTTGIELSQGDLSGRLAEWRQGLDSFSEHPLIGIGANMFRSVSSLGKEAHNSFISILVELGLIGLVLFAIILVIVARHALAHPRWIRGFWLTVLAVWAIGSSTLTWEHRKTTWLFLTFVVVSASMSRRSSEARRIREPGQRPGEIRAQA